MIQKYLVLIVQMDNFLFSLQSLIIITEKNKRRTVRYEKIKKNSSCHSDGLTISFCDKFFGRM